VFLIIDFYRTDNNVKNQFYSTLRRQQRKINRLLTSETFEKMLGYKVNELTTDELYKYMKEGKASYDDIKNVDRIVLDSLTKDQVSDFVRKATESAN